MSERAKYRGPVWGWSVFGVCVALAAISAYVSIEFWQSMWPHLAYVLATGIVVGIVAKKWLWAAWIGNSFGTIGTWVISEDFASSSTSAIGLGLLPLYLLLATFTGGAVAWFFEPTAPRP